LLICFKNSCNVRLSAIFHYELYEKKCSVSIINHFVEEIRKIFLSRILSLIMPKNVLFSLKNCKNCQTLGVLPPDPLVFADGGSAPRPPHQSSNIVNSSAYRIDQKILFSCNYSGSAPCFRRRKIVLHFVCH